MNHDIIDLDVDQIITNNGYDVPVDLPDGTFIFTFFYNPVNDSFYCDVAADDGTPIIYSEPLRLNQPLWRDINNDDLPIETIIPLDESNLETEVSTENLGDTVQLCIDNLGAENGDDDNG